MNEKIKKKKKQDLKENGTFFRLFNSFLVKINDISFGNSFLINRERVTLKLFFINKI